MTSISINPDSKILGLLQYLKEAGEGASINPLQNIGSKVGNAARGLLFEPQEYQTPVFDTGQSQQIADLHNAINPEAGSKQSMLLPFGYDAEGNIEPAVPSLLREIGQAGVGLLGEYEKAQSGTGYQDVRDITPQETTNTLQGLLEVMTGGLIDNAPKSVRSGLSRGGDNIVTGAERDANFKNWFGDSKVVDEAGEPLTVYHGSGNIDNIESFDPKLTGQGNDQIGSGFYFSNKPSTASGYTDARVMSDVEKLGGEGASGVVPVNLSIKNPIKLNGASSSLADANIDLSADQAYEIFKKSPDMYDMDNTPLWNWFDIGDGPVEDWMVRDMAESYEGYNLISLENDAFRDGATEFRSALNDVLGFDGVEQTFPNGEKHYVAWFPEQIKSIHNRGTYDPKDPNILRSGGKGVGLLNTGVEGAKTMNKDEKKPKGILEY
jgi:hypothetical protein